MVVCLCAVLWVESGLAAGPVPAGGFLHVGSPVLQGGEGHPCSTPCTLQSFQDETVL